MLEKAQTDEDREAAEKALEVAKVYEAYERLKKEQGCVDFGDLVCLPVRLLESNAQVRGLLQAQYDHVLVDEYQDVNRSSVRLLAALRSTGENLWAVGDAKQSIYRFRGASSFNMERFGKGDFAGGERGRLKMNYRSVREIVDLFSNFAVGMKVGDSESGLDSDRGTCGEKASLLTVDKAEQQAVVLADTIEAMRRGGHAYRDQVVLCTGNEKLSDLGQHLERLGMQGFVVKAAGLPHLPKNFEPPLAKASKGAGMALAFLPVRPVIRLRPRALLERQTGPQMHCRSQFHRARTTDIVPFNLARLEGHWSCPRVCLQAFGAIKT